MLEMILVVLLVLWLLGVFAFKVTSGVIHVLLAVALVVLIVRLLQGRSL